MLTVSVTLAVSVVVTLVLSESVVVLELEVSSSSSELDELDLLDDDLLAEDLGFEDELCANQTPQARVFRSSPSSWTT